MAPAPHAHSEFAAEETTAHTSLQDGPALESIKLSIIIFIMNSMIVAV